MLLRAVVAFAKSHGAGIVEGYPVEPSMGKMPDPFLWHGVPSAFLDAGFKEVARRSPSRPIMRFAVPARQNAGYHRQSPRRNPFLNRCPMSKV